MLKTEMLNPSTALLVTARVIVIGALAATLARAIWSFALGPEPAQFVESTGTEDRPEQYVMDIEEVAALNLFGTPQTGAGGLDVDAAPDTELDLKLLGIFLASQPEASVAIIGSRGDPGGAYGVGDAILGSARLKEIHEDVVLISRAGIMEALRFDDDPPLAVNRGPLTTYQDREYLPEEPLAAVHPGATVPNELEESIELFRNRLEQDPDGTLRAVGLEPVSINGDTGYRIGQHAGSRQLGRTGLQPGDTIISIDGQPIGDIRQSPEAFGNVLAKGSARLEIQRGERRFFVTTSIATLVALAATEREPA